jgi:hypothetical protein
VSAFDKVLGIAEALDQLSDRLVVLGGELDSETGAPPRRPRGMKPNEARARDAAARYGPALDRLANDLAAAATGQPVPGAQSLAPPGSKLVLFFLDPERATRWFRAVRRDGAETAVDWLLSLGDAASGPDPVGALFGRGLRIIERQVDESLRRSAPQRRRWREIQAGRPKRRPKKG